MSRTPKVTVLMPVYNAETTVGETITSILNQTCDDFEFLIMNDASTDGSRQVIEAFDDPRIRLVDSPTNVKYVPLLNQGITLAQGELIARMDSDDIAHPERLARQLAFLADHPEVVMLGSLVQYFGETITHYWVQKNPPDHDHILAGFLFYNTLCHPSMMIRRDFLLRHNLRFDTDYTFAEDYELWVRSAQLGKLANLQEPLLQYRVHAKQVGQYHQAPQRDAIRRIQQQLLVDMGATPTAEQLAFHEQIIVGPHDQPGPERLAQTRAWFEHLIAANRRSGFFNEKALIDMLTIWWQRQFRYVGQPSLKTWWMHQSSPFSRIHVDEPFRDPGLKNTGLWISLQKDVKRMMATHP